MYKIIAKENLAPNIKKIIVEAPRVAAKVLPGQFVVVVIDEKGEKIDNAVYAGKTGAGKDRLYLLNPDTGEVKEHLLAELSDDIKMKFYIGEISIGTKEKEVLYADKPAFGAPNNLKLVDSLDDQEMEGKTAYFLNFVK